MKIKKITRISCSSNKYDIETKHTHSFFANGILVHNSSMTAFVEDSELHVCSKNLDIKETEDNSYWRIAKLLNLKSILTKYSDDYVVQGELVGPGIQGNKLKLSKQDLYVFNVYSRKENRYLDFLEMLVFCEINDLRHVPFLGTDLLLFTIDELVAKATIKSTINNNVWAEGIVIRSEDNTIRDKELGRLSFKIINPEFILYFKE